MVGVSKEEFRARVEAIVNALTSLPDDLWEGSFPEMAVKLRSGTEIFAGAREAAGDHDSE